MMRSVPFQRRVRLRYIFIEEFVSIWCDYCDIYENLHVISLFSAVFVVQQLHLCMYKYL